MPISAADFMSGTPEEDHISAEAFMKGDESVQTPKVKAKVDPNVDNSLSGHIQNLGEHLFGGDSPWGLSAEQRDKAYGHGVLPDMAVSAADIGSRGLGFLQAALEGQAGALDEHVKNSGLADLPAKLGIDEALGNKGGQFLPGAGAMALMEALPAGGAEAGAVPHLPMRLDPEVEKMMEHLYAHGTADEIMETASHSGGHLDPTEVHDFVKKRDAGGLIDPSIRYDHEGQAELPMEEQHSLQFGKEPVQDKLQSEADAFMAGKPEEPDLDFRQRELPLEQPPEQLRLDLPEGKPKEVPHAVTEDTPKAVQDVVDHVNEHAGDWKNAPEMEVHKDFDDLEGVDPNALGVYDADTGKIRFNTKAIHEEAAARGVTPQEMTKAVLFHESLGHFGLAQHFREGLDTTLTTFIKESPEFRAQVRKWQSENPDAYHEDLNPEARAAEEVLAEASENGAIPLTLKNRVKNFVKSTTRKMGGKWNYSDREIKTILAQAHEAVTKGIKSDGEGSGLRYSRGEGENPDVQAVARSLGWDADQLARGRGEVDFRYAVEQERRRRLGLDHDGIVTETPQDDIDWVEKTRKLNQERSNPSPFKEISHAEDGTKHLEYKSASGETIPIKMAIDNGKAEIAIDQFSTRANRLGPSELRTAMLKLAEAYPEIEEFGGFRRSGAGKGRVQEISVREKTVIKNVNRYMKRTEAANDDRRLDRGELPKYPHPDLKSPETLSQYHNDMADYHNTKAAGYRNEGDTSKAEHSEFQALMEKHTADRHDPTKEATSAEEAAYYRKLATHQEKILKDHLKRGNPNTINHWKGEVERSLKMAKAYAADSLSSNRNMMRRVGPGSKGPIKGHINEEGLETGTVASYRSNRNIGEILKENAAEKTKESWEEWITKAGQTKMTGKMAEALESGTEVPELKAAEKFLIESSNRVFDLSRKVSKGLATDREKYLLTKEIERNQNISKAIYGVVSNAARILNSRKIEVASDKALSDSIRRMMSSSDVDMLSNPARIEELAQNLLQGHNKSQRMGQLMEMVGHAANLPRTMMSSVDLSAPFRQGLFLVNRKEFWKNFSTMFKVMGSQKAYDGIMADIVNRPTFRLMDKAGLALTDMGTKLSTREEAFMSNWGEKIPVIGRAVKGSERAYNGFLNKVRADTFDSLVKLSEDAKIDFHSNPKALKDIASFINNATGRGELGSWTQSATKLSSIFFSPRLIASRVNLLNPKYYADLSPVVRKEAVKSLLSLGAIATTVASLAAAGGADVEVDPRSSSFAKIKVGNTRYDILGGFGQFITLGARLITNETKKSKGVVELGKKYGSDDALDVVKTFARNKLAPIPSFIVDARTGKNAIGEPFDTSDAVMSRFTPLFLQDAHDIIKDQGLATGSVMAVPSLFGVGTQTYDSNAHRNKKGTIIPAPEVQDNEVSAEDFMKGSSPK